MKMQMPDFERPVNLTPPVTTNGGVATDYISLKTVHMAYLVFTFTQAVGHATTIVINQATAVAGTGVTAITNVVPIWSIADISLTDLFTRQTDAVSFALPATTKNQIVIFAIDPASLADGFDCINATIATSSQATNFVSAEAIIIPRYSEHSIIVD